jgi:frataxin-like iron-binding protein CyaY
VKNAYKNFLTSSDQRDVCLDLIRAILSVNPDNNSSVDSEMLTDLTLSIPELNKAIGAINSSASTPIWLKSVTSNTKWKFEYCLDMWIALLCNQTFTSDIASDLVSTISNPMSGFMRMVQPHQIMRCNINTQL